MKKKKPLTKSQKLEKSVERWKRRAKSSEKINEVHDRTIWHQTQAIQYAIQNLKMYGCTCKWIDGQKIECGPCIQIGIIRSYRDGTYRVI